MSIYGNPVMMGGSGGGGGSTNVLSGTTTPTAAQGNNGAMYLKYRGLPEGYTLREYIESSGTQYIDLGIPARIGYKAVIDAQFTGNTDQNLLGGSGDDNNKIYLGADPTYNMCLYMRYRTGSDWELVNSQYDTNRHVFESYIGASAQHLKKDNNTIWQTSYSLSTSTPTNNLILFSRPGGSNAASAKVYRLTIFDLFDSDTLIMDLLPCTRNSDNEPGLYDIINNNFYTNTGSGAFSIGSIAASVIEQSFAKVNGAWQGLIGTDIDDIDLGGGGGGDDPFALTAYIQSSGTQYIDTGYVVKDTSVFEAVLNVSSTNAQWASAFGTRTQTQYACLFHVRKNGGVGWSYAWGAPVDITDANLARFYNEKAVYKLSKITFGCHDPDAMAGGVFSGTSLNIPGSVYLLAVNQNGSVVDTTQCAGKLYRFRIWEDGVLVHEYLPWQENGVVCLKDTVTGNIKHNAGTGSFVYGVDA